MVARGSFTVKPFTMDMVTSGNTYEYREGKEYATGKTKTAQDAWHRFCRENGFKGKVRTLQSGFAFWAEPIPDPRAAGAQIQALLISSTPALEEGLLTAKQAQQPRKPDWVVVLGSVDGQLGVAGCFRNEEMTLKAQLDLARISPAALLLVGVFLVGVALVAIYKAGAIE